MISEMIKDICPNCNSKHSIREKAVYEKLKGKSLKLIHTLKCLDCNESFTISEEQ